MTAAVGRDFAHLLSVSDAGERHLLRKTEKGRTA